MQHVQSFQSTAALCPVTEFCAYSSKLFPLKIKVYFIRVAGKPTERQRAAMAKRYAASRHYILRDNDIFKVREWA